jgi:hypothetical protein
MSEDREEKSFWDETLSSLRQQRDELALQLHLGKAEARTEWEKLREKLERLNQDCEPVKDAVGQSAGNVMESLKLVAGEIKDGFDRVYKSLQEAPPEKK